MSAGGTGPVNSAAGTAAIDDPEAVSQTALGSWRGLFTPVNLIALAWAAFQIGLLVWPDTDMLVKRAGHLGFACALGLALAFRHRLRGIGGAVLAAALTAVALAPAVHLWAGLARIYDRIPELDPVLWTDHLFGLLLLALVLETARRRIGAGLVVLTLAFVAYLFLGPYIPGFLGHRMGGYDLFIDTLFLSQNGLFGVPTGIAAEVIVYFILFAAVFDVYGGGRLIIDITLWMTGRLTGGPAKAAVVSSALTGSISGSAVANVMSTGIFTIPLMKRAGYTRHFAAGAEAAASTGGQIMPPVMGAGAFIMADFLQVPYSTVALAALVPALLYFTGLLVAVHMQARLDGIRPLTRAEIGSIGQALRERWHLLLPLVWLVVRIMGGYDVILAVVEATVLTVVAGSARAGTRRPLLDLVEALVRTSERAVVVALPCALASIIVMCIATTGLGTKFSAVILDVAQGNLWLAVGLGGIGCLVLGCGMPTTSAYIMAAILVAPALAQLGIAPIVAHMFIFYIAVLANVTPPVALAAYAAAGLAGCGANRAGWQAFLLALPGLAVAWAMVLQPSLVVWGDPLAVAWAVIQAFTANAMIGVAVVGWLGRPLPPAGRLAVLVSAGLMLVPSPTLTVAGYALAAALLVYGYRGALQGVPAR